jgi:hypothetical protein
MYGPSNDDRLSDVQKEQKEKVLKASYVHLKELETKSQNFLVVKFNKPGKIIWAPPSTQHMWHKPGEILFAVQLDDGNQSIVQVTVPIFDLRFRKETGWYLKKTLRNRWATLENRITRKAKQKEEEKKQTKQNPSQRFSGGRRWRVSQAKG